ncbi:hypothetical protein F5J12DRAFT_962663 [Pisolithus orientalis]|uniref:uncharacterized protein n=1 Tax=Pisolithus orientalis TaxID=936130 RepID=UPI002225988B|nr:uncharacterized protein F5J12DRAFT_962663 [Pisolithus orientalis]KAI5994284.1 hypothetical protein F5J12DRAFT_962663 [Pisolithus orientalis]
MEGTVTPPPTKPATPDTLTRPKQTSLAGYRSGNLALSRTAVLNDLGAIPQVSLDYFKSAALPPLHAEIGIAEIKTSLEASQVLSRDSGWTAFKKEPKVSGVSEEQAFGPLSAVFEAIVSEAGRVAHTSARLEFVSRPAHSPRSDRSNSTRPDAYLLLVEKKSVGVQEAKKNEAEGSDHDSWDDIAVSFEFKKGDGTAEREDDDKKVIWSLHHIMRSDPCRRATFGVTIENTQTRFWFTCRAVTLVSKSFNFLTEPEHLIHFFCALAFAKDHELGWDPTIRRVCVEGKTQYIITVHSENGGTIEYQTTNVIFDFGADGVTGRGTRVFEVYPTPRDGKLDAEPVVLKDSWRECDRDREDKILQKIFGDLRELKGIEAENEARKYFLTVVEAGDVIVNGTVDGTASLLHASDLPADCPSYALPVDGKRKAKPTRSSEGLPPSFSCVSGATNHSKIHHRIHFRLVFQEICTPIYKLQRLDTVFQTLQDIRKALEILHSVDWVHRDVSATNSLRAGEVGKLADLEYAKRMNDTNRHGIRTGTVNFMACEVEGQTYLFKPPGFFDEVYSPPFRFNPLHDMESLWWIQTWILYYHVDQPRSQRSSKQEDYSKNLFPGQLKVRFYEFSDNLDLRILPPRFKPAGRQVAMMHGKLKLAYIESEKCLPQEPPAYVAPLESLHAIFREHLATAVEDSKDVILFIPTDKRPNPEDSTHETRGEKRPKV